MVRETRLPERVKEEGLLRWVGRGAARCACTGAKSVYRLKEQEDSRRLNQVLEHHTRQSISIRPTHVGAVGSRRKSEVI